MSKNKTTTQFLFKYLLMISISIFILGIFSIIGVEYLMSDKANNFIKTGYLSHLSNYYAPAGVILSFVTVILLYANFRHQQIEFKELKEASILANEIQLINNETQFLINEINKKKYFGLVDISISNRKLKLKDICNIYFKELPFDDLKSEEKIDDYYQRKFKLFDEISHKFSEDFILIHKVLMMLKNNTKIADYRTILELRLPIRELFNYFYFVDFIYDKYVPEKENSYKIKLFHQCSTLSEILCELHLYDINKYKKDSIRYKHLLKTFPVLNN